jgi:hypothetical protein
VNQHTERSQRLVNREFFRSGDALLDLGDGIDWAIVVHRLWLALSVPALPADGDVLVPGSR